MHIPRTPKSVRRRPGPLALLLVLLATFGLVAAACGGSDAESEGTTTTAAAGDAEESSTTVASEPATVRMISWSTPRADQANIWAAQDLGYFEDEQITFEYIPGQGSGDALKQLIAGNGDMAFAGPEGVFQAVDQGADVVAVYNTYPQNAFVLVAKADSGIEEVADLKGKSIGVLSMASGGRYNTTTLLEANGLTEADVTLVATGPAPTAFLEGQVDAFMTLGSSVGALASAGELVTFPVSDYANLPTDVFVVTREAFEDPAKKDAIVRTLRAIRKGTQLMIDDPEQAAAIGAKNGLDITDPAAALPAVEAFAEYSQSSGTEANGLGWFDIEEIQSGADLYVKAGIIKPTEVDTYFTNELVEEL